MPTGLSINYFLKSFDCIVEVVDEVPPSCCPHVKMSYDSFLFCLENDFGAETLWVNYRFTVYRGKPKEFFKHFYVFILCNQGFIFPAGYLSFLWKRILLPRIMHLL